MQWCPGWLGNLFVIGATYVIFAASLFVHGFLIWQGPVERFAAVAIGIGVLAVPTILIDTVRSLRERSSNCDARRFPNRRDPWRSSTSGQAVEANVRMEYGHSGTVCSAPTGLIADFSSLRRVQIHFLARTKELKISGSTE